KWKFIYLEDLGSPSELPVEINALKAQQFRWTKGAAASVRKNLLKVLRSRNIDLKTKIHATFHLMNSTIFLIIMTMALLSVAMIIWAPDFDTYRWFYDISACFMISWFILGAFYWISYSYGKENKGKLLGEFLWKFPLFLSISMGLSLHNSI